MSLASQGPLGCNSCNNDMYMKRANVADRATIITLPALTSSVISTPPTQNEQAKQRKRKRTRQSDGVESRSDE